MKKDLKVAIVQTKVPMNKNDGEPQIERLVTEALKGPVDMIGLPECCVASYEDIKNGYDPLEFLSNIAKQNGIYLFGATEVMAPDGMHNRGFLFDRGGKLISCHDKISLTPIEEDAGIIEGKNLEVVDTEFGKMAILVCKDAFHRYAAWFFDSLSKADVDIVLIPSFSLNITKRSVETWVDALKIMTRWFNVYIVAPGTIGANSSPYPSFGHALIISPNMGVLAEGSFDKEEILRATLNIKSLDETRNVSGLHKELLPDVKVVEK